MKGILLFFASGYALLAAQANPVTIQPRFTNAFRFSAIDAWNMDVQFHSSGAVNVYLIAEITQSGNAVAILRSTPVLLNPGVQSFTSVSLNTAQLIYHSQAIADIESVTGSFPAGNYKICYTANCVTADCDGLGNNALYNETPQCFEFIVEPPTPLLLASPEDKAELDWPRPNFNWIPPMPLSSVNGFHYLYTLVEKQKEQSCNDALVRNRPLYKQSGIDIPTLPYPAELNDLDTGRVYCWKVDGLVNDIPVAQSEVWEFRLKKEEKPDSIATVYFDCKKDYQSTFDLSSRIGLIFFERHRTGTIHVTISSANKGAQIFEKDLESLYGENKYVFEFSQIPGLRKSEKYKITIADSSLKTVSIAFAVIKI